MERPIIVCGPARGGTTATGAILNAHPDVRLTEEVPRNRFPSLEQFVEEVAAYNSANWGLDRRRQAICHLWYTISLKEAVPGRRWGMKTPYAELDDEFWGPLVDPLYVYSLRRGDRVFLSRLKMPWAPAEPAKLLRRYKASIRRYERLRDEGRAFLVQLDRIEDAEQRGQIAADIFEFIGEESSPDLLDSIANDETRVSNPTSKPGEEPELPDEWQELLDADEEYQELMGRFYGQPAA